MVEYIYDYKKKIILSYGIIHPYPIACQYMSNSIVSKERDLIFSKHALKGIVMLFSN